MVHWSTSIHSFFALPLPSLPPYDKKAQQPTYKHTYTGSRVIDTSPSHVLPPSPSLKFHLSPHPFPFHNPVVGCPLPTLPPQSPPSLCLVFYLSLPVFPAIFPFSFSFQFRHLPSALSFPLPAFLPFSFSSLAPSSMVVQGGSDIRVNAFSYDSGIGRDVLFETETSDFYGAERPERSFASVALFWLIGRQNRCLT